MPSQIKSGAILSYATIGINILIGLLYTPWMLYSIGRDNFGLYTLAMSVISFFIFDFGLSSAVTRFIAKYLAEGRQDKADNCLGIVYKIYFVIDAILLIVLALIYFFIPKIYESLTPVEIEKFKVVYVIAAIFSVISFPFIPVNGVLSANEKFIQLKLCDLINKILIVVLMSACLLAGYGLYALVLVNTVAGVCMIAIKLYCVRRYTNTRINWGYTDNTERKEILQFSGWITVISVCQRLIFNIAPSILGIMSGAGSIAILGIAITIEGYTYTFANALNGMFLPKVSRMVVSHGHDILPLMIRVGRLQVMIIFAIIIIFSCIGHEFIYLWVGKEYSISYWCALLLILPSLIHLPQEVGSSAIVATNNVKSQAYAFILMSVCNIAIGFWLASIWGAVGMSASICIAYFIRTFGMNIIYKKKLKLNISEFFQQTYRHLWIPMVSVGICAYLLSLFKMNDNWINFLVKLSILFVVLSLSYWFAFTNKEEKNLIKSMIFRTINHS